MSMLQISALARRIACSNPEDTGEQQQILERLQEVRKMLKRASDHDTQAYLDAAIMMVNYVTEMGHIGGREILTVVSQLLGSLQREYAEKAASGGAKQEPEAAKPKEPKGLTLAGRPDVASSLHMRLIGDLLLGEVMVKLRYIRPETIEEALKIQRATGVRFGEALVQTGQATWNQVKAALRYQEENRNRPSGAIEPVEGFHAAGPSTKGISLDISSAAAEPDAPQMEVLSQVLLGEILVQNGIISQDQLQQGLRHQRSSGKKIGEALIDIGVARQNDIEYALRMQAQMRKYA